MASKGSYGIAALTKLRRDVDAEQSQAQGQVDEGSNHVARLPGVALEVSVGCQSASSSYKEPGHLI